MLSVKEGLHMTKVDLEVHHEREEVDIEALIRKIEGDAQQDRISRRIRSRCGPGYGG